MGKWRLIVDVIFQQSWHQWSYSGGPLFPILCGDPGRSSGFVWPGQRSPYGQGTVARKKWEAKERSIILQCHDGCLELVDWTTGLEYWTKILEWLNCCQKSISWYDISGSHFTNLLHALFRRPALKFWELKVTCIFNKLLSMAGFWHPLSINFANLVSFIKLQWLGTCTCA